MKEQTRKGMLLDGNVAQQIKLPPPIQQQIPTEGSPGARHCSSCKEMAVTRWTQSLPQELAFCWGDRQETNAQVNISSDNLARDES